MYSSHSILHLFSPTVTHNICLIEPAYRKTSYTNLKSTFIRPVGFATTNKLSAEAVGHHARRNWKARPRKDEDVTGKEDGESFAPLTFSFLPRRQFSISDGDKRGDFQLSLK